MLTSSFPRFSLKATGIFFLIAIVASHSFCQGLESISAVQLKTPVAKGLSDVTFILTPGQKLEIIDAAQPWPPRWFVSLNDTSKYNPHYENARFENGNIVFYKSWGIHNKINSLNDSEAYITCNKMMEPVDSFKGVDLPINIHDLRINEKGEKLFPARLDTVLNLSGISGNKRDTAIVALVDIIEIVDANNKVIFRWNPVEKLGIGALYFPYGGLQSRSSVPGHVDWSHANSILWDYDGNILYSFRHIGIGKISRTDGHIIWRMDRNKIPYISGNDTIAFYLQHGLEIVNDNSLYTTYALYSSGDSAHANSYGLEFTVNKKNQEFHLVKKKLPVKRISTSLGGNYEIEADNGYILNYGANPDRTNPLFEYGNDSLHETTLYGATHSIFSYGVHQLNEWKPPRPTIAKKGGKLKAKGKMNGWVWYSLSGKDNTKVVKVGEGNIFIPGNEGIYCVAGKYGIGYSVSVPFHYKP